MPKLAQYLLKLATDRAAFDAASDDFDAHMRDAGLNDSHREALSSGDTRRITHAVMDELAEEASTDEPYCGTTLTIMLGYNHPQFMTRPRP